jgi:hypothetical protein
MPIRASEKAKYPPDWPIIRARILERAGHACEFAREDGSRCNAPNHAVIARMLKDLEQWYGWKYADGYIPSESYKLVRVVITIAHLNHDVTDSRDENLKAGCQLHHLRHDQDHHQKNAAWTRRVKKQNVELFPELDPNGQSVDTSTLKG